MAAGEAVTVEGSGERFELLAEELVVERRPAEGYAVSEDRGLVVAVDTEVTQVPGQDARLWALQNGLEDCHGEIGGTDRSGIPSARRETAQRLGLPVMGRVASWGFAGCDPARMGLGPVLASPLALRRAGGLSMDQIELVEINEAFAAQVIPSAKHLGIDWDKLNVNGGAIALGHPFGMTGARIMTTLLHNLETEDKTIGLETMCVGGGQGMAMIVERLS